MTNTQTIYDTEPMPEPVYATKGEIERETLAVYRNWRAQGWSEGSAEQSAAEFYATQLTKLHLRQLEEAREAAEIEVVCAWCKRHLSGPVGATNVSHGICPVCAVNMEAVTA